jgi:glycosyltransferase involved in cell wall biosynthesis
MNPAVSVVLPVRNGGAWLPEAVESILRQTLADFELLLVDDHSEDDAIGCLDRRDKRLRILPAMGRGVVAAFNTGLRRADGAFVARMDADDISLPQRLESQRQYLLEHHDVDICGGCFKFFGEEAIGGGNRRYQDWQNALRSPEDIHRQIFVESPIANPSLFARREAIEQLGSYRDTNWPEDYDLLLRADAAGMKMGKPEEVLLRWREHEGRLTRIDSRYALNKFQAAKAHYLARHRLGEAPVILWGAGPSGRLMHDLLIEEGVRINGFLDVHPRRIGGKKRDLPVWPIKHAGNVVDEMILVAVGAAGARDEIRAFLNELGRREGSDYLFVA